MGFKVVKLKRKDRIRNERIVRKLQKMNILAWTKYVRFFICLLNLKIIVFKINNINKNTIFIENLVNHVFP